MPIIFLIGRIVFAWFWIHTAYHHFKDATGMAGYAAAKHVPAPKLAVVGTGILALLGGLSILLGLYPIVGIILLVIFLLGVTYGMHAFWNETDPATKSAQFIQFKKNVAILGATLMFVAISMPWFNSL